MLVCPPVSGVGQTPVVYASRIFGFAKVVPVFGFSQPAPLARSLTRLLALCFRAEALVMGVPIIWKELLPTMTAGPVHWVIHGEIHR